MIALPDLEVNLRWWLIQECISNAETRGRLRSAWGLCARHATALLAVGGAYRHAWIHAGTILYLDLIEHGIQAVTVGGPFSDERAIRNLRATAPCPMCELAVDEAGGGAPSAELLGRGDTLLEAFAREAQSVSRPLVCRLCSTEADGPLCRPHLIADHSFDLAEELKVQRGRLGYIARHLIRYARSFRREALDIASPEDRASLIEAVGWCSGWSGVLAIIGGQR